MEEWLCDVAMRGDIESLYELINTDYMILNKVCVGIFKGKNPLHVAISAGQREFVLKLLEIKPDLAEVLDTELRAALHVASAKGDVEIVKALVMAGPNKCLARDRDGNNPFHIAAMEGHVQVLEELIRTSFHRAQVKGDRGDTILHLCVKYYRTECLQLILDKIPDPQFVNAADVDGNTILHLAVSGKQSEMVKLVLSNGKIEVNATNQNGRTALDITGGNPTGSEIQEILLNAGAKRSKPTLADCEEINELKLQSKRRNTLLIVASLVATVTFQLGVSPPGGFFPDNSTGPAGEAILAYTHPYAYYIVIIANTLAFLGSLSTIVLLIFALPELNRGQSQTRALITWFTMFAMGTTYVYSLIAISQKKCHVFNAFILSACTVWTGGIAYFAHRPSPRVRDARILL